MKIRNYLTKLLTGAIFAAAAAWVNVAHAMPTQLGIGIDSSGSVSSADFAIQRDGLASALATFTRIGGGTRLDRAINLLTSEMTGSANFGGDSIINVSTDGDFTASIAVTAAADAKAAGIDAITAEAIGPSAGTSNLMRVVYGPGSNPDDGSAVLLAANAAPENPLTSAPWVVPVTDFTAFGGVLNAKIQAIVVPPSAVPEPGALALLGIGMLGFAGCHRRNRRRRQ